MHKRDKKILLSASSAFAVSAALHVGSAFGGTLYTNLSNTASGSSDAATGTQFLSETFTTDATKYTSLTATLDLQESVVGVSSLSLYTDGGLQPGSLVGTFVSPTSYTTTSIGASVYSLTSSQLTASTTYWLVFSAPSGEFDWGFTSDNILNGTGLSPDSGTTWYSDDSFPYQVSVVGSTAVPEPGFAGVVAATSLVLLRRSKNRVPA